MTNSEFKTRKLIEKNRFNDDRTLVKSVFISNFIFAILFCMAHGTPMFSVYRMLISLVCAILFISFYFLYDWQSTHVNLSLIFLYLMIFLFEFILFGVPVGVTIFEGGEISKGILFDLVMGILPFVYLGLKVCLIYPLIKICYSSRMMLRYL